MAIHNNISHTNANRYACALKKIMDQKKLKNNCIPNEASAGTLFSLVFVVATRYKAIPISTYKIVHITGKSHPGGDNGGLLTSSNSFIFPAVSNAESPPTANGIAMQINNFFHSILKSITPQHRLCLVVIIYAF